jgi:hypothetical protein
MSRLCVLLGLDMTCIRWFAYQLKKGNLFFFWISPNKSFGQHLTFKVFEWRYLKNGCSVKNMKWITVNQNKWKWMFNYSVAINQIISLAKEPAIIHQVAAVVANGSNENCFGRLTHHCAMLAPLHPRCGAHLHLLFLSQWVRTSQLLQREAQNQLYPWMSGLKETRKCLQRKMA